MDTLFFRGAKPFYKGEDSWSDSQFLPFPSVIWGSLYAHLYSYYDEAKEEKNFKNLKIKNIYLYNFKDKSTFVAMPNDVFSDGKNLYIGEYDNAPTNSSYPLKYISYANTNESVERLKDSSVRIDSLIRYMKKESTLSYITKDELYISDAKVGIAIDKSRKATKKSHLYRVDLTQFCKDYGFLVEYALDGFEFQSESGYLKLGGESKVAQFEHVKKNEYIEFYEKEIDKLKAKFKEEKYFKLYIKTPTAFKEGWRPILDGFELLCANLDETLSIGGFDMKNSTQREMKRYVPSGAVYVFTKQQESFEEIEQLIIDEIAQHNERHKGFGLFEILEA